MWRISTSRTNAFGGASVPPTDNKKYKPKGPRLQVEAAIKDGTDFPSKLRSVRYTRVDDVKVFELLNCGGFFVFVKAVFTLA